MDCAVGEETVQELLTDLRVQGAEKSRKPQRGRLAGQLFDHEGIHAFCAFAVLFHQGRHQSRALDHLHNLFAGGAVRGSQEMFIELVLSLLAKGYESLDGRLAHPPVGIAQAFANVQVQRRGGLAQVGEGSHACAGARTIGDQAEGHAAREWREGRRETPMTSATRARISALVSTESPVSSNSTIGGESNSGVRAKPRLAGSLAADHRPQNFGGAQTDLSIRVAQ